MGYLTRNERAAQILKSRSGVVSMTAAEALRHLEILVSDGTETAPVAIVSPVDWSVTSRALPLLRRPTFAPLAAGVAALTPGEQAPAIAEQIASLDDTAARHVIAGYLVQTIAGIMRVSPDAFDRMRPLADMGVDSLMTMELRLAVEEQLGLELPVSALTPTTTVQDLAGRMLARVGSGGAIEPRADSYLDLVGKHTAAAVTN